METGYDKYEEVLDNIDFGHYKGMFYAGDPKDKYQDPTTGAHFDYRDMCERLRTLQRFLEGAAADEFVPPQEQKRNVLKVARDSDSRNPAHALPQQGYGTLVGRDRPRQRIVIRTGNLRLFSKKPGNGAVQELLRSKSFDRHAKADESRNVVHNCFVTKGRPHFHLLVIIIKPHAIGRKTCPTC